MRGGRPRPRDALLDGNRARRLRLASRARLLRPERYGVLEPNVALLPRSGPRFAVRKEFAAALDHRLAREPHRCERGQRTDHRGRYAGTSAWRRRQRASVRDEGVRGGYPEQGELHGFSCADAGDTRRGRLRHSTLMYARNQAVQLSTGWVICLAFCKFAWLARVLQAASCAKTNASQGK